MVKNYKKLKEPDTKSKIDAYDYINSPILYYFFRIKKKLRPNKL